MNASKIFTDLVNSVKTTKVQENGRQAHAIRRPVNVPKRPVIIIKAPINAIQQPVNSTLSPVNAIQSLAECESSPDQLMPQDTAITLCNKPGVKRNFLFMFFLSLNLFLLPLHLPRENLPFLWLLVLLWIYSNHWLFHARSTPTFEEFLNEQFWIVFLSIVHKKCVISPKCLLQQTAGETFLSKIAPNSFHKTIAWQGCYIPENPNLRILSLHVA